MPRVAMSVLAHNFGTALGSGIADRAPDGGLGATGPAVVGVGFALLTLVLTVTLSLLQHRPPSGREP